jgi:Domain of unknown function (DUF6647)
MLYPLALLAMLVIVALTGPINVRAEDDQSAMPPQLGTPMLPPRPDPTKVINVRATETSTDEIAKWLSTNFGLPYASEPPRLERVSRLRLYQLRHKAFLPLQSQAIGGEHSTPMPQYQREVVAVYDDATHTVYLPEGWTGETVAEQSVLVHEMVHHLQNLAGLKFACAGEREKPAYLAQDKWLRLHGLELEKEFEVDMFTVVALSACMN